MPWNCDEHADAHAARDPSSWAVVLDACERSFGAVRALRPTSLRVAPGAVCVVLGVNGAGKTTLLQIAAGALQPTSGRRCGRGSALFVAAGDGARRAQRVGQAVGVAATLGDGDVDEALCVTGLQDLRAARVGRLSAGQRTLVTLATAVAARPSVVCLDEPETHLDPERRRVAGRVVRHLAASGAAVVVATHDPEWLAGLADATIDLTSTARTQGSPVRGDETMSANTDTVAPAASQARRDDEHPARATATAQAVVLLIRRELAVEAASWAVARVVVPFAVAGVLLAGLAFGPAPSVLADVAAGLPWLVVLLLAAPLSASVAVAEREEGCWDLLRGLAAPGTLLAGKLVAMWLWLLTTWSLSAVLVVVAFGVPMSAAAIPAGVLGSLGLACGIVIYGTAGAPAGRAGSGMLTALLLPAGLPALLAGTQAATPATDALPWLGLLGAYDLCALAVAWAVYPTLLEE